MCLPGLAPSVQGICCFPDCLPFEPAGAWCPSPTHQHTLEVVGLVKAEPDLVPEAAAALAHVGDAKAEAGQAGGAVLQVEVPIRAGTCGAAREWATAGPWRASPAPAPCPVPDVSICVCVTVRRKQISQDGMFRLSFPMFCK